MRGIDYRTELLVFALWRGKPVKEDVCPMLADLDRFLLYLEETDHKPGHSICPCPFCAGDHRWALLKALLIRALRLRDRQQTKLLAWTDADLEPVRDLYGGEEKYQEMLAAADEFFAKLPRLSDGDSPGTNAGRIWRIS
jgi:hypothetical protein